MSEQEKQLRAISLILYNYVKSLNNKINFQTKYRGILFWGCSGIVILFSIILIIVIFYTIKNIATLDALGVTTIIAAMFSFITSIFGLIHTITKYCFPENDESDIIKIVELIQNYDLESIKETNRIAKNNNLQD